MKNHESIHLAEVGEYIAKTFAALFFLSFMIACIHNYRSTCRPRSIHIGESQKVKHNAVTKNSDLTTVSKVTKA
jgi:hypothetical protein